MSMVGVPWGFRDCDAQRDPTLEKNVGVLTLLPCSSLNSKLLLSVPICVMSRNIFPLFRRLHPLVRCSLRRNTNANPLPLTQLPFQVPPLDHLRRSWIKPLPARRFSPPDPSRPEWIVCWSIAFDALRWLWPLCVIALLNWACWSRVKLLLFACCSVSPRYSTDLPLLFN